MGTAFLLEHILFKDFGPLSPYAFWSIFHSGIIF